jgi:ABC-type antimicrobial peptide transport system permease subunit
MVVRDPAAISARALRSSPVRTILISGLISIASLSTSCASGAAAQIGDAITSLSGAGQERFAWITGAADRSKCVGCFRKVEALWTPKVLAQLNEQLPSGAQVGRRSWHSITVRSVDAKSVANRAVQAVCTDRIGLLPRIQWLSPHFARSFSSPTQGTRHVVVGAELVDAIPNRSDPIVLRTSTGRLEVVGRLSRVSGLSHDAALNRAIVISDQSSFGRIFCRRGAQPLIVVKAADTTKLSLSQAAVVDLTRSVLGLHPMQATPLSIDDDDRIGALIARLNKTVGRVAWIVPAVIGLLCGISMLAVNLVYNVERIGEFAIMRAVGCTKRDLVVHLVYEAAIVSVLACIPSMALTVVSLSAGATAPGRWLTHLLALGTGFVIASLLTAIGMILPGVHAIKAASIISLERSGL